MKHPFVIVFAGVPGSSKSIVAQHLSVSFDLPVYSNDTVRSEVKEDMLADSITIPEVLAEYERRGQQRQDAIFERKQSLIFDFSVDRRWTQLRKQLEDNGYAWCIINMNMSFEFMERLYSKTKRQKAIQQLPDYMKQHESFMQHHGHEVAVSIGDQDFVNRLQIAEDTVRAFIKTLD